MDFETYVMKTTGGTSGGKTGGSGTSGGSSGSSSGGQTGGSGGSGGAKSGGSTGSTGSNSTTGGSGGKSSTTTTIKKPKDLQKLPPVTVHQPDGTALVLNMQDFCVLPNANAINAVAFQQCLTRKKHDDDDMPLWGIVLIAAVVGVLVVAVVTYILSGD